MKQFLYRIQPTRPTMLRDGLTEREAAAVGAHFEYLKGLVAQGVVLMAGRTQTADEHAFGIVIFVAASEADATLVVQNDPAVKQGVMKAELFPYQVALWSAKDPTRGISSEASPVD